MTLLEKQINIETFQFLTNDDINYLIPEEKLGARIKFRTNLLKWRKENVNVKLMCFKIFNQMNKFF